MDIVVFALVVLILAAFVSTENKTIHLIWSITCLILLIIGIYSALAYTSSIDIHPALIPQL